MLILTIPYFGVSEVWPTFGRCVLPLAVWLFSCPSGDSSVRASSWSWSGFVLWDPLLMFCPGFVFCWVLLRQSGLPAWSVGDMTRSTHLHRAGFSFDGSFSVLFHLFHCFAFMQQFFPWRWFLALLPPSKFLFFQPALRPHTNHWCVTAGEPCLFLVLSHWTLLRCTCLLRRKGLPSWPVLLPETPDSQMGTGV